MRRGRSRLRTSRMIARKEGTSPAYHFRAVQSIGCMKNLIPPKPKPLPDDTEDLQILQGKNTKTVQDKIQKGAVTPVAQPSNRRKILPNQFVLPATPQSMIHCFKALTAKFTISSYRDFACNKVSCSMAMAIAGAVAVVGVVVPATAIERKTKKKIKNTPAMAVASSNPATAIAGAVVGISSGGQQRPSLEETAVSSNGHCWISSSDGHRWISSSDGHRWTTSHHR
ncbi:hypothetical protein ACOSQ3_012180 [Xanthoceras sorbifolium]